MLLMVITTTRKKQRQVNQQHSFHFKHSKTPVRE
jgi:hypothetical protein